MDNAAIDILRGLAVPSANFGKKHLAIGTWQLAEPKPKAGPPRRTAGKIFENLSDEAVSIQPKAGEKARAFPITRDDGDHGDAPEWGPQAFSLFFLLLSLRAPCSAPVHPLF
jgi:hypothetical protein